MISAASPTIKMQVAMARSINLLIFIDYFSSRPSTITILAS